MNPNRRKLQKAAKSLFKALLHKTRLLGRGFIFKQFETRLNLFAKGFDFIAANESDESGRTDEFEAVFDDEASLILAANDSSEQLIVPYVEQSVKAAAAGGTTAHVLQVFDRTAANEITGEHRNAIARFAASVTGLLGFGSSEIPVYYRHPDQNPKHADRREYGAVSKLRAGNDGLYGVITYNEFGKKLLDQVKGLKISPTWGMRLIDAKSSPPRARPHTLISLGLTQFPNIPTAVGVNEKPKHTMNPELLKRLLALLSFSNERIQATIDGTADAISLSEISATFEPFKTAANEAPKVGQLEKQVETLTTEKTEAEGKLTAASETITGLKSELAAHAVDKAIASGKITPAHKDEQIKKLVGAEDFATACNELGAVKDGKAIKTSSALGDLATDQSQQITAANEAHDKFMQLVAANQKAGMSYNDAWTAADRSELGKKLNEIIRQERADQA